MIKILLPILFFCCYTSSVFSQTQDDIIAYSDSLFELDQFEEAISYYDNLIGQDSSEEMYFRSRGYAYLELNELKKGEADYQKALELNPNCSFCYSHLAKLEANRGNLDKALQLLELAIGNDEKNDFAFYMRANLREFNNNKIGALFDYNKAIELAPDMALYYTGRGLYNLNSGYAALAIRDLNKGFMLDSNDSQVIYPRAKYYANNQDWDNALKDLNRCIKLQPTNSEYYATKATILAFLQKYDEAIDNYDLSLKIDSTYFLAYMNRARAKYSNEDMDGTCADNSRALELIEKTEANKSSIDYLKEQIADLCDPKKKSYYYQRGIASYNLGQFEQAIVHYDQGLIQFPNSAMLLSFRGNALVALGKDALAIVEYKSALQHKDALKSEIKSSASFKDNSVAGDVYYIGAVGAFYGSLAECYANIGNYETAITYADSAINFLLKHKEKTGIHEVLSSNYNIRGVIHNVQGNYEKAKSDFLNATHFNKSNPLPHVNMAFALISESSTVEYKTINMGFYINPSFMGRRSVTLPVFSKKKIDNNKLEQALKECNIALELDKKNAFAYLVRAQIKILMKQSGYCLDVFNAKELGILNAEVLLGIKCK
ncbi:MAG: tetratricopeptide repeat protein [Crocinitomix sp.]|nr:tetratricopeptide repeat protein [Crocinitomix sp.]